MRKLIRSCCISLTLCVPFTNSWVRAEVLYTADAGFAVENKVQIQQSVDVVWQALVNDVDAWWPKDHSWWAGTFSIDPHAGGCFCERSGERSVQHMAISMVDPGKLLRMTGGLGPLQGLGLSGALDWQIVPDEADPQLTEVTLTYRVNGYTPGGFGQLAPVVDQVQGLQLGGLKSYLD
ncbi:hypothetical protein [Pseudohongiella spirulinae]|uniref:Polyketide cyclase/dehydrase n=1 Tax=Pseudohongiella spirulinae TaxID=1249552 RepID=A0A0S2KC06_9GAMM|nr:hypothetical protein [Pseudohongiella spirulinae]ALO45474.1 polyketide cyclase/dehydrase [Pseudohongiella spirulinae]